MKFIKLFENYQEFDRKAYLKWKKNNVTLRGMRDRYAEANGGSAILGEGLYTAHLSNRSLAKQYGNVYFVLNGIPKKPKTFNTLNEWEIWFYNNLVCKFSKDKKYPDRREFEANTTIKDEMLKLGYDGIIIKGREMVNYKPENIKYFETEKQLEMYYEDFI